MRIGAASLVVKGQSVLAINCRKGRGLTLPGGAFEPKDVNLKVTSIRELREETGVVGDNPRLVWAGRAVDDNYCCVFEVTQIGESSLELATAEQPVWVNWKRLLTDSLFSANYQEFLPWFFDESKYSQISRPLLPEYLDIDTQIISVQGEMDCDDNDQERYTGHCAVGRVTGEGEYSIEQGYVYPVLFANGVSVFLDSNDLSDASNYIVLPPVNGKPKYKARVLGLARALVGRQQALWDTAREIETEIGSDIALLRSFQQFCSDCGDPCTLRDETLTKMLDQLVVDVIEEEAELNDA